MFSILEPNEKVQIIAEINSFLKGSGLNTLTKYSTENEIRTALGAVVSLKDKNAFQFARSKTNSLAYLIIARVQPDQALLTLIKLQSLFSDTKNQDLLLRDVLLVARINGNQTLLENLGYIPKDDKRHLGPQEISVDEEFNQLRITVKTKDALFKLTQSCLNRVKFFNQFTRLDLHGRTYLHHAAVNNTLEALITYFPSPELYNSLMQEDDEGKSPLRLMAKLHPIDNLARIIKRLETNSMRENALCLLNSENVGLIEYCILLNKSPFPLLLILSPFKRWELLWTTLPNKDKTILQLICSLMPNNSESHVLFSRLFTECTAETARTILPNRFKKDAFKWKIIFHLALEVNAFIVLEMLAFLYRELGQDEILTEALNSLDKNGLSLFHRGCETAEKLTAVAALYSNEELLFKAFRTSICVTAIQRACRNKIPAVTVLSLIPPEQRFELLWQGDPRIGKTDSVFYQYLNNLLPVNADLSDSNVDFILKSLLTVLMCFPVNDAIESLQSILGRDHLKPLLTKVLKYNRWGEITLNNGQKVKHTVWFVLSWHRLALLYHPAKDQYNSRIPMEALSMLFPTEILQDINHPQPKIESQFLIKALLTVVVIYHQNTGYHWFSGRNDLIQFLKDSVTFASVHSSNKGIDVKTIKNLVDLVRKLISSPDEDHYKDIFDSPNSVARQLFHTIKYSISDSKCMRPLNQIIAHFDWFKKEKLFPADGIDFSHWILCLRKIFNTKNSIFDKIIFMSTGYEWDVAPFREFNRIEYYSNPSSIKNLPNDYNLKDLYKELVEYPKYGDRCLWGAKGILRFLEYLPLAVCRELLSSGRYQEINVRLKGEFNHNKNNPSLLYQYAGNRKNFFQIFNQVYREYFTLDELKVLLEIRRSTTSFSTSKLDWESVLDIFLFETKYFNNFIKLYKGNFERLRDHFEVNYEPGKSKLQQLAEEKDPHQISEALTNLSKLYGSREAVLAAMIREDWYGRTALHYAAGELLSLIASSSSSISSWALGSFIRSDKNNKVLIWNPLPDTYVRVLARTLDAKPAIVLPILNQMLEAHSAQLNANKHVKYLFYKLVVLVCFDNLNASQHNMLSTIVTTFDISLLKENESWRSVMSVLALLINSVSSYEQIGELTTVVNASAAENTPNQKIIPELFADKDFAVCALVHGICGLITGKAFRKSKRHFTRDLIAYTKNDPLENKDKNMLLLVNALQKLATQNLSANLPDDNFEDLPSEEVCKSWVNEIYPFLPTDLNITCDSNIVDFCFNILINYIKYYASLSTKELIFSLRTAATIFQSLTNEFTKSQNKLFDLILMPLNTARFYKFKNYAPHDNHQHSVLVDESGFFADNKKKGKKKEVTERPVPDMFANRQSFLKTNNKEADTDGETDGSEFSQGERKEKKEKEPIYTANQYQNEL